MLEVLIHAALVALVGWCLTRNSISSIVNGGNTIKHDAVARISRQAIADQPPMHNRI
ncbi:hypothetical protein SBV1_170033 [Verrucomicrobia bacterium]|nr:hypothetical protein SBV1_170033 [Verrucomicrobiota bacterium]